LQARANTASPHANRLRHLNTTAPEVLSVVNDPAWLPLSVTMVPVSSGKVSVRLVLLLGLAMVNMPVPEASGAREIFDII
jgi:hypothetical protein